MSARRRIRVSLAVVVALSGLLACDKPTPAVTLYSGPTSINDNAFSFCFDGQDPAVQQGGKDACRYDAGRPPKVLQVRPGDEVTVDVDKDVADSGWYVALRIDGQPASRLATQKGHVVRFQPDFSKATTQLVEVRKLASPRDDAKVVGLWIFAVVPR